LAPSEDGRQLGCEPAHASVWTRERISSDTILLFQRLEPLSDAKRGQRCGGGHVVLDARLLKRRAHDFPQARDKCLCLAGTGEDRPLHVDCRFATVSPCTSVPVKSTRTVEVIPVTAGTAAPSVLT
jgi:hypothetical protein